MSKRTYKTVVPRPGEKGVQVFEFREDGERDRCVLFLPGDASAGWAIDAAEGLQKAYESGRDDRSGEILGDAGRARGVAAASSHKPHGAWWDPETGQTVACHCGKFTGALVDYDKHLAYEILQAAGTEPRSVGTPS